LAGQKGNEGFHPTACCVSMLMRLQKEKVLPLNLPLLLCDQLMMVQTM
jgi:hypothetical protein